jgi:tetratricopeptide (TPR) repeat protein
MRVRLLHVVLVAAVVASGGCVYYNGMYNANRLARSARKAERDGRTFQANGLWGQVATKAESVIVRHPTSKYASEAQVLRGVALARMGQCQEALDPLSDAATAKISSDLREEAWLAYGRCQAASGNAVAADAAFLQLVDSKNPDRREEAQYQHARVLRKSGRYTEALQALPPSRDSRLHTERLLALGGAGQVGAAMAIADTLLALGDSARHWDSLVVALGEENPLAASNLVDRVRHLPGRTPDGEAKLLLDDGLRLEPVDTALAARRFREVAAMTQNQTVKGRAEIELLQMEIRTVSGLEQLAPVAAKLRTLGQGADAVDEIALLGKKIERVQLAGSSATPESPQGDLRLFLAAESARDSLNAPHLAEGLFLRIPDQFPQSPYAPKAILAAQHLNPALADSTGALLEERYGNSPYLSMIHGETTDEYRQLEDSLGGFAAAQAPKPDRARRPPPIRETEQDRHARQPRPIPRGTRVPEPQ